jgi:hypothetical protein
MADLEAHKKAFASHSKSDRGSSPLAVELAYRRSLRPVEAASVERCSAAGLFAGVSPAQALNAGARAVLRGEVEVREGLMEFLGMIEGSGSSSGSRRWGVASVSWSEAFLRGVVSEALRAGKRERYEGGRTKMEGLVVLANRIDMETGQLVGPSLGIETRKCSDCGGQSVSILVHISSCVLKGA